LSYQQNNGIQTGNVSKSNIENNFVVVHKTLCLAYNNQLENFKTTTQALAHG